MLRWPAEPMIRRWCLYLALVLGCVTLNVAYQGWLAWLLLMALLWMPVLSLIVSLPAMLTLRLKPDHGGNAVMGSRVELRVRARCLFPMPLYRCRVRVTRTITAESFWLQHGDLLPTEHCGQLLCQPEKRWVYDYLGLFRLKARKSEASLVTVRPVPVKMEVPADLERHMAKGWRPKPGGGFAENHELRLYRPGDMLNQIHWKLTAKTGKLMIREAMEPQRSRMRLTLDLQGTPQELDNKMGKLLWMGKHLLDRQLHFEITVLTGEGVQSMDVSTERMLTQVIDRLLGMTPAEEGSVLQYCAPSDWCCHIGGGTDEA